MSRRDVLKTSGVYLAGALSGLFYLGFEGCKKKGCDEDYIIGYTAERVGVDVDLLKAIRKAENGVNGLEFGIIPTLAYESDNGIIENGRFRTYKNIFEKQCSWCAWTIKKNLERYESSGEEEDFISFLAERYCPIGAENDPRGLNKNWEKNVRYFYEKFKD